jgi:hypothetical protein
MKKLLLAVFCLPVFASAQNFHFSTRLGMGGYQGDLKAKAVSLSQLGFLGSLGVRYDLTEKIALRSYFTLGSLKADDKKGTVSMKERNLNFKSGLFEWEAAAQYSFLNPNYSWWIPYASLGVGVFHFKPTTKDLSGRKVSLQPLSTEGQGVVPGIDKYKLTQLCIPLSNGV